MKMLSDPVTLSDPVLAYGLYEYLFITKLQVEDHMF